MARPRFSIGIDLGTTNCALAFAPIEGATPTATLAIPQWETPTTVAAHPTLPSFLYLPEDARAAGALGEGAAAEAAGGGWIAGRLARRQAAETPGRVAHSAKSWLGHHATDCNAPFLPWGSDEIAAGRKLSPIRAAALLLASLRAAWNERFAASGAALAFDAQEITITVPASFDTVARRLTLDAAAAAGFPERLRLLDEPQAAFYAWLERHDGGSAGGEPWPAAAGGASAVCHVLVVDIGGGTSDFSLFALAAADRRGPSIRRIAVSEHILLGGDNIDLALAHRIEPRLADPGGRLAAAEWASLVARCRDLKEAVLAAAGAADETFPVAVAGRGAGLIAGTRAAHISRAEIEDVVLDGFFPRCAATDRPRRTLGALKEWGLPYAQDSAITRHLAAFLRDRPRVDVVLFNGGALAPAAIRRRICAAIGSWQDGAEPAVLDNAEPQLAVARGAAHYGRIRHDRGRRIEAGAAHAVFIAAHKAASGDARAAAAGPALVCILPREAAPEEVFAIGDPALEVRLNTPVRFETYASTRHQACRAGSVVAWNDDDFRALPPLETVIRAEGVAGDARGRTLRVTLQSRINALGLVQVALVSADERTPQSWPLEFSLALPAPAPEGAGGPVARAVPNASAKPLAAARERIETLFGRAADAKRKLTAARVLADLEKILGLAKADWDGATVRALWPALQAQMRARATSVEHEEAWLQLAGFVLRPGFGAPLDDVRIEALWRLRADGLCFAGRRTKIQEYVLWRRVAGGLAAERQEALLAAERGPLDREGQPPAELVRLAGALERINTERKAALVERFVAAARDLLRAGRDATPHLAALGMLLSRTPFHAGPESVLAPELVARAYEAFAGLDWTQPAQAELKTLFLRAARVTGNRGLDLPASLRTKIAGKLEKCGVPALRTARVRAFLPIERAERAALFGESLPPGLLLVAAPD